MRGCRSLSGHLSPSLLHLLSHRRRPPEIHIPAAYRDHLPPPPASSPRATQGAINEDDSLNPAPNPSSIRPLPWRWPPKRQHPPSTLKPVGGFSPLAPYGRKTKQQPDCLCARRKVSHFLVDLQGRRNFVACGACRRSRAALASFPSCVLLKCPSFLLFFFNIAGESLS